MKLAEFEQIYGLLPGTLLRVFDDRYILSDKKEFKNRPHRCLIVGDTSTALNLGWFIEYETESGFEFELTEHGVKQTLILLKNNKIQFKNE